MTLFGIRTYLKLDAEPGISPPNFLVSPRKKILGAGLSTNSAEFVNRQSVRIQGANF